MLFMQMSLVENYPTPWGLIIVTASGLGFVLLVVLGWLASRRKGQMAHTERMRAMELGYVLPERSLRWAPVYCFGLGVGVPIATFVITWLATLNSGRNIIEMWIAPIIVSGISIIGSTIVTAIVLSQSDRSSHPNKLATAPGKPMADVETLDFGGRIGHG